MRAFAFLLAALLPAQATDPAAMAVGSDCAQHAADYVLVRADVLARLEAADNNLPRAEEALRKAQADLQELKKAADQLQAQKTILESHITLLEKTLEIQRKVCADGSSVSQQVAGMAASAWETLDAPAAFVTGAGMCVGIAWGLNQVAR